jgi:non-ribosomal peptide synthetase component E (peptide arylation enzyme)
MNDIRVIKSEGANTGEQMMISTAKQGMAQNNFREAGYWLDKTVDQLLNEAIARTPDKIAIIADRADREQALRLTYRELGNLVDRAASSLSRLGVGPRDVVTVQLPNWWEFVVAALACSKIGAVLSRDADSSRARVALCPEFLRVQSLHRPQGVSGI